MLYISKKTKNLLHNNDKNDIMKAYSIFNDIKPLKISKSHFISKFVIYLSFSTQCICCDGH